MARPLTGIRVLDLTRVLAGPHCTMLLEDMGAEIIKIKEPARGDDSRAYPPFSKGISAYYANLNRNKKSLALNLKDNKAREALYKLIKISDVIVENYKPGTMAKLGLSYETVRRLNPRIIYASISGFGQFGPYKDRPGYDIIAQAMSGIMSVTGWPDTPPTRTGTAIGDVLGGLNCCVGILAALNNRNKTGRGERIDISLLDCAVSAMETLIQIYTAEKRVPGRTGNRYEFIYPYDSFPAKNGWVVIAIGNDTLWKKFCGVINRPDLLASEKFALNRGRVQASRELKELLSEWTASLEINDIVSLLLANSIPCAPINDVAAVVADEHIAGAREMILNVEHPIEGTMKITGCPIRFSEAGDRFYAKAPLLGEHSAEILENLLNMPVEGVKYFVFG